MFEQSRRVAFLAVLALLAAACSAAESSDTSATAVLSNSLTRDDVVVIDTGEGSLTDVDVIADATTDGEAGEDDGAVPPGGGDVAGAPSTSGALRVDPRVTELADASNESQTGASNRPGTGNAGEDVRGDRVRIDELEDDLEVASGEVEAAVALTNDLGDRLVGGVIADAVEPHESCEAPADGALTEAPEWVTNALADAVRHPDFAELDVSVSVWIDGWGEVATRDPDLPLVPASNEKILVAHAANELIDPTSTLDTIVERVGADLVLRAGGDPTFSTWRANQLVEQVAAAGVTSADRLIVDVSAFPQPSAAPGWQSWQIRNFVGPLSGLMLDDNRWNTSDEFLESPALVNGEWFAGALRNGGVAVGSVEVGTAPPGTVVGTSSSAPVGTLVRDMMLFSDNQIADMMTLQLGLVEGQGTLADGIAQIGRELAELCVPLAGVMDDGSGLSRSNFRSAREFQEILRAIRTSETASIFESQLPIGGVSGTLRRRFGGDPGRVQAKTGTIFGGRALSGYATTDSGRDAVFSIIINGDRDTTSASLGALDALVRTILRS